MPKSATPIRLSQSFMELATGNAALQHRSTAQQIEHWAMIGRQVESLLSPDNLIKLNAGLLRIKLEEQSTAPVSTDEVAARLDALARGSGFAEAITTVWPRYQTSRQHPGYLERLQQDGRIEIGQFENGRFKTIRKP